MVGLYLYIFIIGHKSSNILSILKKLTLQKELQTCVTKMFLWTKSKNLTTAKLNIKHKNPCLSRELNPGPLAPKADELPLHHRIN